MAPTIPPAALLPTPLSAYPPPSPDGLFATLAQRASQDPFNLIATAIFVLAIAHTFLVARFSALAHRVQHEADEQADREGRSAASQPEGRVPPLLRRSRGGLRSLGRRAGGGHPGVARLRRGHQLLQRHRQLHRGRLRRRHHGARLDAPVVGLAEGALRRVAGLGRATPAAWWLTILTIGPVLGSLITEPAAMTICALLLGRQIYERQPSARLKYATLGLLFVNVSIGGTLTHFAAPPVLMVARPWGWDTALHGLPLRLARRCRHPRVERALLRRLPEGVRAPGRRAAASRDQSGRDRGRDACRTGARLDHPACTACSWPGPW